MEFNFKGKIYQVDKEYWVGDMPNTSIEFQYDQFMHLIQTQDWITLENRIVNQLRWGGLIEINK
jgi:hypothetical protein